jgi:hypothetical protein
VGLVVFSDPAKPARTVVSPGAPPGLRQAGACLSDFGRFFFTLDADAVDRDLEPPAPLRFLYGLVTGLLERTGHSPAGSVNSGHIGRLVKLDDRFFFHLAERHAFSHSPIGLRSDTDHLFAICFHSTMSVAI